MKYFERMIRGQLNCNPLNIRRGSAWKGLAPIQTDKSFCQFTSSVYGIRAALIVLRTYAYKYNRHTIREVISRFAPTADGNNVDNYVYLVKKNIQATIPPNSNYRYYRNDDLLNCWFNMKEPKMSVYYLLKAMAVVESNYTLKLSEYEEAVKML